MEIYFNFSHVVIQFFSVLEISFKVALYSFFGKRGIGTNCTSAQMFKISILMMPQGTRVFE